MIIKATPSIPSIVYVKRTSKSCLRQNIQTQWIGLRENLQETIDFPIKYGAFLYIFP